MPKKSVAAADSTTIVLPELKLNDLKITIVGETPLIVHAWSQKAKLEMLNKQMKVAQSAREAKNPELDFVDSLYTMQDGGYGFPSVAFKAAAVTACTSIAGITKVAARQAFRVVGEISECKGAFDKSVTRLNLARIITPDAPTMREDMVRVGMGTADLRYRGEFWPWAMELHIRFMANVVSPPQLLNMLSTAGACVGVGEWRMEKDGDNGLFRVATAADQKMVDGWSRKSKVKVAAE